jgi:hypothetical protein
MMAKKKATGGGFGAPTPGAKKAAAPKPAAAPAESKTMLNFNYPDDVAAGKKGDQLSPPKVCTSVRRRSC